jgi:hypothetical protein
VISWFQVFAVKCNLYRYTEEQRNFVAESMEHAKVGLYKLKTEIESMMLLYSF